MGNLRDTLVPGSAAPITYSKYIGAGLHAVQTKSQRNNIPLLYRSYDSTETTIVFVSSDNSGRGSWYRLNNSSSGTTTIDSDWDLLDFGASAALSPVGQWDPNTDTPTLVDTGAAGLNGNFYFVINADSGVTVTNALLFAGSTVTVHTGDWIVSSGSQWVVVTAGTVTWDSLTKPSVINDYVAGTVIHHTHPISDIVGLTAALATKYDSSNLADPTALYSSVPDGALVDVAFLRAHFVTSDAIVSIFANGNGTTTNVGTSSIDWGGSILQDTFVDGTFAIHWGDSTPIQEFWFTTTDGIQNRFGNNEANFAGYQSGIGFTIISGGATGYISLEAGSVETVVELGDISGGFIGVRISTGTTLRERVSIDGSGVWRFATVAGTTGQVLTTNSSGVPSWQNSVGTSYSATSGVSLTGTTFFLGGTITSPTTIGLASQTLSFTSTGTGTLNFGAVGQDLTETHYVGSTNGYAIISNYSGGFFKMKESSSSGTPSFGTAHMKVGSSSANRYINVDYIGDYTTPSSSGFRLQTIISGSTVEHLTLDMAGNMAINLTSDATGDIFYRNSSGYLTRLGIGSSAQVLTVASGLPSWLTPSAGTTYAASNGLTLSSTVFSLGGSLTANTTVDVASHFLEISGINSGQSAFLRVNNASGTPSVSVSSQFSGIDYFSSLTISSTSSSTSATMTSTTAAGATAGDIGVSHLGVRINVTSDSTGDIYYRNSSGIFTRLGIGTSGYVLTVVSGLPSWVVASSGFANPMTTTGDIIIGGASGAATRLAIGANNYVLTSNGTTLSWQPNTGGGGTVTSVAGTASRITVTGTTSVVVDISSSYIGQATITTVGAMTSGSLSSGFTTIGVTVGGTGISAYALGDIIYASSSTVLSRLAVGTNGYSLQLVSGLPSWQPTFSNPLTTNGDILIQAGGAPSRIAMGTTGQVLSSTGSNLTWITPFTSPLTTNGDIIIYNSGNTRLAAGTAGYVLTMVSGLPAWAASTGGSGGLAFTTLNPQSGNYTFLATDLNNVLVQATTTTTQNLTIPPDSSLTAAVGSSLSAIWDGTGVPTFVAGAGVTILSSAGSGVLTFPGVNVIVTAVKKASNVWYLENGSQFPVISANTFYGGPSSGSPAIPTFRSILTSDLPSFTTGSIIFADASGLVSQDNSKLFFDNTNFRLGIGTSSPGASLDILGSLVASSGSAFYAAVQSRPTYNTTGSYSGGVAYGFGYFPVLTSVTGLTHYAFFGTSGLFTLGASSAILGSTIRMDIRGISGGTIAQFADSTNVINALSLADSTTNPTASFGGDIISLDKNLIFGTLTGTKIGTSSSQKLAFYGATPVIQQTTSIAAASLTANSGTTINDASTFDGYTLKQIVKSLRILGILA